MSHITIHHHSVSYDESHDRLRHAVYYLESILSRDEAETFFKVARDGSHAHFEDDRHTNLGLKKEDGEYILYLREE